MLVGFFASPPSSVLPAFSPTRKRASKVMPISFLKGSIFKSDSQVLVCPVNTRGVAGAGLALQFKDRFPAQIDYYRKSCRARLLKPGQVLVDPESMDDDPVILFAATKDDWRSPSRSQWVNDCIDGINIFIIDHPQFTLVSIPALGCGLGRLSWPAIKRRMLSTLDQTVRNRPDLQINVFEPGHKPA